MDLRVLASVVAIAACAPATPRAAAEGPKLSIPIACEVGRTCEVQHYVDRDPGPGARDYHCKARTYDKHSGVDIRVRDMAAQRRGVDVLAAAPGRVARLRDGKPDISARAVDAPSVKGQECGNGVVIDHGDGWETQYCHLAQGSVRVKQGDVVQAGTPIGRVGLSGETEYPHVHMTVRHNGKVVDPFSPTGPAEACGSKTSMWTPQAARALAYKDGVIFNAGFAGAPVAIEEVEDARIPPVTREAPVIAVYMLVIGPQKGDVLQIGLRDPSGRERPPRSLAPLDRDKSQAFAALQRAAPPGGWAAGKYVAELTVLRGGKPALTRTIEMTL